MKFEIKNRDASGRICKFTTNNETVTTPNLMPVINPNRMLISPKEMKKLFGTEIVITNSYIIKKDEKLRKKALDAGVHKLIDFDGTIMTDSGTFQSYVYGDVDLKPLEIVEFQKDIGVDIGTILDIFGTPDQTHKQAEESVKETLRRAKASAKIKGEMLLSCPIQGSIYPDLRNKSATESSKLDVDFFPIGGVVPLMENQRYADLVKVIISSKQGLDPSKPVHLFGCGHPLVFPLAVALGCDFFDSSSYAKYASDGRLIFSWGTEKLDDLIELPCSCPVCSKYTADELRKLSNREKVTEIAKHNLYICFAELKKIRNAISQGSLWELVERRANSNPYLLDALNQLKSKENKEFLEKFEPISKKKALFYTGNQTIHRPIVYRVHKRLFENYTPRKGKYYILPEAKKPYSTVYAQEIKNIFGQDKNANIIIDSSLGPVPIELDEMYPFAQSVFPELTDDETEKELTRILDDFTRDKEVISFQNNKSIKSNESKINFDLEKISSVCNMQFGRGAGAKLLDGKVRIVKSKKTKKIRNIYCDDKHILSMRAPDGLFTLKLEGAKVLHKYFASPRLRVQIDDDAVPFVKDGKSVFSKFVLSCESSLRPYDECIVVDKKDNLLAVGRCILNSLEMEKFNTGMAVKIREHI